MKRKLKKLIKAARARLCAAICLVRRNLPLINCLLLLAVLSNQAGISDQVAILKAGIEMQLNIAVQDYMLDMATLQEFMKRFGDSQGV